MNDQHRSLILVGAGGHARVVLDTALQAGFAPLGVLTREGEPQRLGLARLGGDDWIDENRTDAAFHIAFGPIPGVAVRESLFARITANGLALPPICSPGAFLSSTATIGDGTLVVWGAVVNAGAVVGRNCIVNTRAIVEHDATVGDHCHLAPGSIVCGDVRIGDKVIIGAGAVVLPGLRIADRVTVGAGAVVTRSVEQAGAVVCGNPARVKP